MLAATLAGSLAAALYFSSDISTVEGLEVALRSTATQALIELQDLGYDTPSLGNRSLEIALMNHDLAKAYRNHGGLFQDGKIYLRLDPLGSSSIHEYLRHELAHALSYRSCQGKGRKLWQEEAFALRFAQPLDKPQTMPQKDAIERLRRAIDRDWVLTAKDRDVLYALVTIYDWPLKPCMSHPALQALLEPDSSGTTEFAYRLSYLVSGRLIAESGDTKTALPLGSLWKIPMAAALLPDPQKGDDANIAKGLVTSNPAYFRGIALDRNLYQRLTGLDPPHDVSELVGGRNEAHGFSLLASIADASRILRASLLANPNVFANLSRHYEISEATLFNASEWQTPWFRKLNVIAKTGTVSSREGEPQWGYLMLAWPQSAPEYLAVFRGANIRGRDVLSKAATILHGWQSTLTKHPGSIVVHTLTQTTPQAWTVHPEGVNASFLGNQPASRELIEGQWQGRGITFNPRGALQVEIRATNPHKQRLYSGLMEHSTQSPPQIITDPLSYAEGVIANEAALIKGSARTALAATVIWNAVYGSKRYHSPKLYDAFSGVCDTTHCGVFHGNPRELPLTSIDLKDVSKLLEELTLIDPLKTQGENFFSYSLGGTNPWSLQTRNIEINRIWSGEFFAIHRHRLKTGQVEIKLISTQKDVTLTCEQFRNALKLPSCPGRIDEIGEGRLGYFLISGVGAGHGKGFLLEEAMDLANQGLSASELLKYFFADKRRIGSEIKIKKKSSQIVQ